ncbi:MAG: hypothetical protein IT307_06120 [Chloroflexi bacterium]|nr:hypothetical protein [Chloroflexota bacterium]
MRTPTTPCPEAGVWRAWLDREAGSRHDDLTAHESTCAACRQTVRELQANAAIAASAVGALTPPAGAAPDGAAALARPRAVSAARQIGSPREPAALGVAAASLPHRQPGPSNTPPRKRDMMILTRSIPHWRLALSGLAAALTLTFLVGTPAGHEATAAFLAQFRSQHFTVVTLDPNSARHPLAELERLGTVTNSSTPKAAQEVKSLSEASQKVGFKVVQPDASTLPNGLPTTPKILVSPPNEVRFTFDRSKVQAYLQQNGKKNLTMPASLDGASLVLSVPAAALLQYGDPRGSQGLLIGQTREVTGGVEGRATLDEARDVLLDVGGWDPDTVRQLRSIRDWKNTLPIPIPVDRVNWKDAKIGGGQGLILADNTGVGSAAIWENGGRVFGIAGTYKASEIQRVADSIRP